MYRKFASTFFIISTLFMISCESPKKGLDQLFPGPGFEKGWSWKRMPKHCTPADLYEYIDGEAELYLSYHFKELATLTYFWGSPEDTFFTVDIYDMGDVLDAFGLYSNYRYPGYTYVEIGTEAYQSDYGLKFYKGRYVVELKMSDMSEKNKKGAQIVARRIADRISDPPEPPEELSLLPEKGQVPKTLRYSSKEMLNQAFLPSGLDCRFEAEEDTVTGFVAIFNNPAEAKRGSDQLRTFFKESGDDIIHLPASSGADFGFRTSYRGFILVSVENRFVFGIEDLSSPQKGIDLLKEMRSRLQKKV